ncbi:hypothetical protein RHSP_78832 [Rhizobium freirei PRF 81]|uniref:Transmembrane protein n=1 Tax=Rhizobium freirei PRF 81 TaxID=363754 RepID=N6TUI5_9HYPH|nr:hypothetical protein RHSP_78832 [Rhizobium freirei PRF 81]
MARSGAIDRHAAGGVLGGYVGLRRGLELGAAAVAAEVESAALIVQRRFAGGINRHAANRVARHRLLRLVVAMVVVTMTMVAVIVFVVQCHIRLHCPERGYWMSV